jgi:hypothetical protein
MTVHLIKLCVGAASLTDLANWQAQRLEDKRRAGEKPELLHITRQTPKRAEEVLDGGSLYWVMSGFITARQQLLDLRPVERDGVPHCALVYHPDLITVEPRPRRPFQGWRYFDPEDAPRDMGKWVAGSEDQSLYLQNELISLGLL